MPKQQPLHQRQAARCAGQASYTNCDEILVACDDLRKAQQPPVIKWGDNGATGGSLYELVTI